MLADLLSVVRNNFKVLMDKININQSKKFGYCVGTTIVRTFCVLSSYIANQTIVITGICALCLNKSQL